MPIPLQPPSPPQATLRGTQKSILERQAPATFPLLIEMRDRNYWVIHSSEHSVDSILKGVWLGGWGWG